MANPRKLAYRSAEEIAAAIAGNGLDIHLDLDYSVLRHPVRIGAWTVPNSLAIHPMEGCDATPDGAPSDLTIRRYQRFTAGGAGLIWFEATAITPEVRSNASQLYLSPNNVGQHAAMLKAVRKAGRDANGYEPLIVTQLTHPGRQVKQSGRRSPVITYRHPVLDQVQGLPPDYPIVSDTQLEQIEDDHVEAARLAQQAGYDGVDIKSVHRYLYSELLTAHTRPGNYGGSFENRVRALLNTIDKTIAAVPGLLVTTRINGHDGVGHPYAWGMKRDVPGVVDLEEPVRLVRLLYQHGIRLVSVSLGRRPAPPPIEVQNTDHPSPALAGAGEHPLGPAADHIHTTRDIQKGVPEMLVMGAAYSAFGRYFPLVAAANLRLGWARMIGLGRMAYAYPDFARDLLQKGAPDPRQVCVACGRCSHLLEIDAPVGCVIRDAGIYRAIYQRQYLRRPA